MSDEITILAIETSCDETGVAILRKKKEKIEVLAESVASQADMHAITGGVVPEAAAREHVLVIRPMIESVLTKAGLKPEQLDGIAVTVGPGLQPALSVGVTAARALAYAWDVPIIPVHHLEGHVYSALLQGESMFPALALLVSGGHTMLVRVSDHLTYTILGSTLDDAAGEAFDKVARILELPYPGGPEVSKIAKAGNDTAFDFPRPMIRSENLDFSFSGLKTAVLYALRDLPEVEKQSRKADIAASFEEAVVDTLARKVEKAIEQGGEKLVLLAGGVAANERLRARLSEVAAKRGVEVRIAPLELCGDNATMIGQVGLFAYEKGRKKTWRDVDALARMSVVDFSNTSVTQ